MMMTMTMTIEKPEPKMIFFLTSIQKLV